MEPLRPKFLEWKANPHLFVTEVLKANPEAWQIEALKAIATSDRLAVRSGHGVGKSAFLAWVIIWWLCTRFPAKIPCTAPTAHQLSDVLWGELSKWYRNLPEFLRLMFELKADRLELKSAPNESFAVARTARKEQPEAFQGFHSDNLLFVVDEASGVEDIIFEVGEGAMSTHGAKTILTGNPTRTQGYFYDAFHRLRSRWSCLKVACADSSRVSKDYISDMAAKYGLDSNIYKVRVLGEFPSSEDDAVIPLYLCESAINRKVDPLKFKPVWGVDVARFGDDRTTLAKRRANVLLEPVKSWRGKDTMQVAGILLNEYESALQEDKPGEILVDVIGIGAGVVDRARELGLPVRGINVGESAPTKDQYARLRDELWFKARAWFDQKDCSIPQDDDLIAELTTPKYDFLGSTGKIQVEPKDKLKERGVVSPDLADAFCLTFAGGYLKISEDELRDRYSRKRYSQTSAWAT